MDILARRRFLAGAATAALFSPGAGLAASLVATPRATEGPFYPDRLPLDRDNDLTRVDGRTGSAEGTVLDLAGHVRTVSGDALAAARLEIWQCDANGVYLHSASSSRRPIDPNFQGYGTTTADAEGGYRFRTIVPVPYPGRTPHIHLKLTAPNGRQLVSQIYVAGHPMNDRDFLYSRLAGDAARRASEVVLAPVSEKTGAGAKGRFEIVLQ